MSMMCVIPARATSAIFCAFQMPPPNASRPVIQVMSMQKFLCRSPCEPLPTDRLNARISFWRCNAERNRISADWLSNVFIVRDRLIDLRHQDANPVLLVAFPELPDDVAVHLQAMLPAGHPPCPKLGRARSSQTDT